MPASPASDPYRWASVQAGLEQDLAAERARCGPLPPLVGMTCAPFIHPDFPMPNIGLNPQAFLAATVERRRTRWEDSEADEGEPEGEGELEPEEISYG